MIKVPNTFQITLRMCQTLQNNIFLTPFSLFLLRMKWVKMG